MPISAKRRKEYGPCWPLISMEIRERDRQRCKFCRVNNGAVVLRPAIGSGMEGYYIDPPSGDVFSCDTGEPVGACRGSEFPAGKMVRIVLTVAHLNHDVGDMSDGNLAALCQKCHLKLDQPLHAANAAATRRSKLATGDLFA